MRKLVTLLSKSRALEANPSSHWRIRRHNCAVWSFTTNWQASKCDVDGDCYKPICWNENTQFKPFKRVKNNGSFGNIEIICLVNGNEDTTISSSGGSSVTARKMKNVVHKLQCSMGWDLTETQNQESWRK